MKAERCAITFGPIDIAAVVGKTASPLHGATCLFIGTTRSVTDGRTTLHLEYEAYIPMALRMLEQICDEIAASWTGTLAAITHRLGRVDIGEASVCISVSAPHRHDCYEASRYAIERLKQIVPIWKKEIFSDGAEWVQGKTGSWNPL